MLMLARAAPTVPFPSLLAAAERELLWTVLGLAAAVQRYSLREAQAAMVGEEPLPAHVITTIIRVHR